MAGRGWESWEVATAGGGGEETWEGREGLCVLLDFKVLWTRISVIFFDLTILYPIFGAYFCLYLEFLYVIPVLLAVLLCVFRDINLCVL